MSTQTGVLEEARRLYAMDFAIQWLHPRSKQPIGKGWTTGPRKPWKNLIVTFCNTNNVSVRLGTPSKLDRGYLAVIDVDVKSKDPRHRAEAEAAAREVLQGETCPRVETGRKGGSCHYYCLTENPFKTFNAARSEEEVRYHGPSKPPSQRELTELTPAEIKKGVRIGAAWEVSLYSDGRHVVLPPSIHPDTGEEYRWVSDFSDTSDLPVMSFDRVNPVKKVKPEKTKTPPRSGETGKPALVVESFKVEPVALGFLDLSDDIVAAITEGAGVTDRSAYLMKAVSALRSAGCTRNQILTILTDTKFFMGQVAYEHAKTKIRGVAVNWLCKYTVVKIEEEKPPASEVFNTAIPEPNKLSAEEMVEQAAEFAEDRDWTQDVQKTQQGQPKKLVQNVHLILSKSVAIDVIRRDEFAFRDSYSCQTPWGARAGKTVSDDDIDACQLWLGRNHGFEPSKNLIESAFVVLARENAYDPVKDFLRDLPKWDGVERLNGWLKENFQARGDKEYLAQVFRKWMVAMVMRVLEPGAKFDWMPIFEGPQGVGKSSFGRILVGDEYFLDWLPNLNDKDAALSLQGMWGIEMGELSQFKGNALENIKAFVTRTVDKIRPPYGKRLIESPRRCVFFGTTNRPHYLLDETGNRRFKPVEVGALNFKALRRDRLQLFAEAKMLWLEKAETELSLEVDGTAKIFEQKLHIKKMVQGDVDSMRELFLDFVEKQWGKTVVDEFGRARPAFNLTKFSLVALFHEGGPFTKWKLTGISRGDAGKMLSSLGGEVRGINGRNFWRLPETFVKPEES